MVDLAQKESTREITKIFVKLKFNDFTRTTAERAGLAPALPDFRSLLDEAFARTGKPVRLIGVGVRFAEATPETPRWICCRGSRVGCGFAVATTASDRIQFVAQVDKPIENKPLA